ncbi:MAG TPA: signal recognition particle-docking protein FtsY [Dehalococcoidia bacterium]|nr:signal recognition particle-docking protein FtsY [Dehalococcoidia bacterium]
MLILRIFKRTREADEKTEQALERTRKGWFGSIAGLFDRARLDEDVWESLEELLIGADTGVSTTHKILGEVQTRVERERIKDPAQVREALQEELVRVLQAGTAKGRIWGEAGAPPAGRPAVVLIVGVNGTGKTTSVAKLAQAYREDGDRVVVAAADTFRAAAIEQLKSWGEVVGADVIAHKQGADPGAVVFDALTAAESRGADVVLIDTAGRLHTKFNLMEELGKIRRVIERKLPEGPDEVMLVLDATTGQNALVQARAFAEVVPITALCLTKLDGTSKGGIVFAVSDQLEIPVRFIGTGERPEDLTPFDAREFVAALFQ